MKNQFNQKKKRVEAEARPLPKPVFVYSTEYRFQQLFKQLYKKNNINYNVK